MLYNKRTNNVCMTRTDVPVLLIFHYAAVSLKYFKETGAYYFFDSHTRGINGLCSPSGTAVLSVF